MISQRERGSDFLRVAKIAGIQIVLNYWFIVLIMLFVLADMGSKVLLVFSAVLWHEVAHALVAVRLGYRVKEVQLLPFGGVARIEGLGIISARDESWIAAAGPAASLVLAAFAYGAMLYFATWSDVWEFYMRVNMMLAGFNLLPGLPLDGGRMLRAWLTSYMDYKKATLIAARSSKCLSACLLFVIIYQYIESHTVNLTFLVGSIFLYTVAKSEIEVAGFRTLRVLAQKKGELMARGIMPTAYFTVLSSVMVKDIIPLFKPNQYSIVLIFNRECKLCKTITETEIWEEIPEKGLYITVGQLIS